MILINEYLDFSQFGRGEFTLASVVIFICYMSVLVVSILDTRTAISRDKRFAREQARKAIEEGKEKGSLDEVTKKFAPRLNSWGIRRTISKLSTYYAFMLAVGFLDMLFLVTDLWQIFHFPEVPWVSVASATAFIGNECLSLWENSPKNDTQNVEKSLRRFRQTATEFSRNEDLKVIRRLLEERGGSGI